ncbi:hypothetical protein [Methylomonas koyamae]|uniref:hypothetical protein n=1 Tax=Methylomonas koyamae TaxID=702114 RepID=UPI0018D2AAFB
MIVEQFGRPHKSILRSLDKLKDRLKFVPISYSDSYGREQKLYQLDERAFLIAIRPKYAVSSTPPTPSSRSI